VQSNASRKFSRGVTFIQQALIDAGRRERDFPRLQGLVVAIAGAGEARERASPPVLTERASSLFDGLKASAKMGVVSRSAAVGRRSAVGASTGA
jgi:hypothetical protein